MNTEVATFSAAPLDRTARIVTHGVWLLARVVWLLARVAGDGGSYGYLGRYRAEGRTVHAFVTNRDRVVLLEVGGSAVALSPDDPEAFIAEVQRAA